MPELPDLQAFSHNLQKRLHGKKVFEVKIGSGIKVNTTEKELQHALAGKTLDQVYREGKELRIKFGHERIGLHLMLHGKMELWKQGAETKNLILSIAFDDGTGLALTDYQKFASVTLNPQESTTPDALDEGMTLAYLTEKLGKTRTAVKTVLLDQHIIRGIGNAYADEILWDAGISPFSISNKIPANKIKDLAKSIERVLQQAEKEILKAHPDIINGEVRDFLKVHNSKKTHSPTGASILIKPGTRKTYYTEEQGLFK